MIAAAPPVASVFRIFVAFVVARASFGLAYLAASAGHWSVFWYYPLAHRWAFEVHPDGLAMAWFGTTALGFAAAIAGGSLTWFASARRPVGRVLSRPGVALSIARAGGLVLLIDFAYFGWTLTHQPVEPLPLPAWYCPR